MSQRQQLERILEIDRQIRAGRYPNAASLARELETGKRVIYMDRAFMVDRMGAPIQFNREKGGWYYTDRTWVLPTVMVTEGELLAFFLSIELSQKYLGSALEKPLRSAMQKIYHNLKGPVSLDLETMRNHYSFAQPIAASTPEQTLLELHKAIRGCRQVKMGYYTVSRDEHTERIVDPYHLHNQGGDWYLVAFDHKRQALRLFHAGRIEWMQILSTKFQIDRNFSAENWLRESFQVYRGQEIVDVAIRFDAYQARWMRERRCHETQTIEELPDGGLILRFQTGGLNAVLRWVLQYGEHAEVLEPSSLREEIIKSLRKMGCYYHKP